MDGGMGREPEKPDVPPPSAAMFGGVGLTGLLFDFGVFVTFHAELLPNSLMVLVSAAFIFTMLFGIGVGLTIAKPWMNPR